MEHEQPTKVISPSAHRSRWRVALLAVGLVAVLVGTATAGFFVGQNTRKSDGEVATLTSSAVAAESKRQEEIRRKALDERKARDQKILRRVVTKMKKAAKRRAEQSYAAGQSVGYSAGEEKGEKEGYVAGSVDGYVDGSTEGYDAGLTDGSDSLDCSDDPDVYWLPPCY